MRWISAGTMSIVAARVETSRKRMLRRRGRLAVLLCFW